MDDSENISEILEEKLGLVRRFLLQALDGLEAKEKKLQEVQESVMESSKKLNLVQLSMQERVMKSEEVEKVSPFLVLGKGFQEMELKIKKLGLIERDVMIRLEKLEEEKKSIKGFFEKVELMGKKFETKKLGYDGFVGMCSKESEAEDSLIEVELTEDQGVLDLKKEKLVAKENELEVREKILALTLEWLVAKEKRIEVTEKILGLRQEMILLKDNEIEMKDQILGLRQEEIVFEDNGLETKEKILGLRLEENVFRGNELEAREKILSLWKELDLKGREDESIRKLKEQFFNEPDSRNAILSGEEMRAKSRKREGMDMNGNCKSLKRCRRVEGISNSRDDNEDEETVANDLNESGSAHSGRSDSGCDRNGLSSANPGLSSALAHSDSTADHKELDSRSAHLSLGSGSDAAAGDTYSSDTSSSDEVGIEVKSEAISGSENDAKRIHDFAEAYPVSRYTSDSHPVNYPNLLINDFDKDKVKNLAAGQTWASYCQNDDLPRLYFRVLKVLRKPRHYRLARLRIVWLQPLPNYRAWKKVWKELKYVNSPVYWKEWIDAGLPVGCGVFKCGKEQTLSLSLARLSGQLCCKNKNSPYLVHPSKGETWALYSNWDIVRSASNPENHKHCNYEIVEVLGRSSNGFRVAYLDKVRGFVSLFQRRNHSEKDSFLLEDHELFRLSHKVPSFKMTGNERQGVPEGSFELDPKDLPAGFVELNTSQQGNKYVIKGFIYLLKITGHSYVKLLLMSAL